MEFVATHEKAQEGQDVFSAGVKDQKPLIIERSSEGREEEEEEDAAAIANHDINPFIIEEEDYDDKISSY
jgi:hypothetical protein